MNQAPTLHSLKPDPNAKYLCFTINTNEDHANRTFTQRYNQPPEQIFDYKNMLWLGPIPSSKDK